MIDETKYPERTEDEDMMMWAINNRKHSVFYEILRHKVAIVILVVFGRFKYMNRSEDLEPLCNWLNRCIAMKKKYNIK